MNEAPLIIKYIHPYFTIIFGPHIRFLLAIATLACFAIYLEHDHIDIKAIKFFYILFFLIPIILNIFGKSSYLYMVFKTKNIVMFSDRILINGREYLWDEITLNFFKPDLSNAPVVTPTMYSIIINKNGKAMEEILCVSDSLNLFGFEGEDFYEFLNTTKLTKQLNSKKFNEMTKDYSINKKILLMQMFITLLLALVPMVLLYFFIKNS